MAECGFNAVTQLLTKQRNRLQIPKGGDLRFLLSSMEPSVRALAGKHRSRPLHLKFRDKLSNKRFYFFLEF